MTVAELNRLITIRNFVETQDSYGMVLRYLATTNTYFAKVRMITNSRTLENQKLVYGLAYEITMRHEPSRVFYPTSDILYENKRIEISGIMPQQEGNIRWQIVTGSASDFSGDNSTTPVTPPTSTEIHVIGNVTIGGSQYANWTGKIIAARDGLIYTVRKDGSASEKEINYDESTGLFTYPDDLPPLQSNEHTDIFFV